MKKLVIILSLCTFFSIFTACGKSEPPVDETTTETEQTEEPKVEKISYDCKEFDIISKSFTNNILLSLNLEPDYVQTENKDLLFQNDKYFIGEFKHYIDEENFDTIISVFEYDNQDYDLSTNCTKISTNWYIENESIAKTDANIRTFYTKKNNYLIGLSISNMNSTLDLEESLKNLSIIVNEHCELPDNISTEENKSIADATLETPAKTGEWVNTSVFNSISNTYEPICVCITNAYTGSNANSLVTNWNNLHPDDTLGIQYDDVLRFGVYEYSVFFPSSFTTDLNGNIPSDLKINIELCNTKDNSEGINGFTDLNEKLFDISPSFKEVKNGSIWTSGLCIYQIPIDFNNYYIKVFSDEPNISPKYFKP